MMQWSPRHQRAHHPQYSLMLTDVIKLTHPANRVCRYSQLTSWLQLTEATSPYAHHHVAKDQDSARNWRTSRVGSRTEQPWKRKRQLFLQATNLFKFSQTLICRAIWVRMT